jgi:hypothetical protein
MDKATLLQKIKNDDLTPKGRPNCREARVALHQLHLLDSVTELDKKALGDARKELISVVAEYRRALKVKRMGRRKHTRG